jgi:hypothetical protein
VLNGSRNVQEDHDKRGRRSDLAAAEPPASMADLMALCGNVARPVAGCLVRDETTGDRVASDAIMQYYDG